jgi:hypothetical protein
MDSVDFRKEYDFWKLKSYAEAEALAEQARKNHPGIAVLPYEYGEWHSPRWGIIHAPTLGDDVSHGFNGDYYPVGKVEQIGKDYKRIKAGGVWYYRRKLSPSWIKAGGTWSLVQGIIDERNPSF